MRPLVIGKCTGQNITFHFYTNPDHWSIGFYITTYNLSIAVGPLWFSIFWRLL